jgi:hypothetical protein
MSTDCTLCDVGLHWRPCQHPERPSDSDTHFHSLKDCRGCLLALHAAARRAPSGVVEGIRGGNRTAQFVSFKELAERWPL